MTIIYKLYKLQDNKYADFQSKFVPTILREKFIGVRVPQLRKLAKELIKEDDIENFLKDLPHHYYEENLLHALIISEINDYDNCIEEINKFLPFVDNWAVCDGMSPKVFKNNRDRLIKDIRIWVDSDHLYTCRFALKILMSHFLDEDYKKEYLEIPANVKTDEYYLEMMVAWFFATALAKQWDDGIIYLEDNFLSESIHNKIIQKARESRRITEEEKGYLKELRR